MAETTAGGRRVPGGTVYLFTPPEDAPAALRDTLLDWARANRLDPERVIGSDGVEVDLVFHTIRYWETVDPGTPDALPMGPGSRVWKRRASVVLRVEPPAELCRPPVGYGKAASVVLPSPGLPDAYDWEAYTRTCDPDRQLDGLGDLALFLGGSETSFTGDLLRLVAKAQATPDRFRPLALAFPREVTAWQVWQHASDRTRTAAELCALLVANDEKRRALHYLATAGAPHVLTNADIWGPETDAAGETGGPL